MKKIIIAISIALLGILGTIGIVHGASVFQVFQGGTGASTLTGCLTGNGTGPITGSGSACGTGGFAWPFDVFTNYVSTSSKPVGFLQGIFSTASSTFSSALRLSSLSQGYTYTGSGGLVGTVSTSTLAGQVFPFTSFTNYNATSTALGFLNGFFSTASSTFSGNLFLTSGFAQGLLYTGSAGLVQTTATTSVSCSGSTSCTAFTALGNTPITISSSGGSSAATSTADWIVYNDAGTTKVYDTIAGTVPKTGSFSTVMNWIVNQSTSTNPARVNTQLRSGLYTCDASVIINGGGSRFGPDLVFSGNASSTTIIVATPKCFDFRNQATVNISHVAMAFRGDANVGFYASSTALSAVQSSIRESFFDDINGFSTTTGHTGYLFDFVDDFRNNYHNIMFDQLGNGWRSTNGYTNAQFINGDSHVSGFSFCELNNSGAGVCWDINGRLGVVNQNMFEDINGVSNDTGDASNDILFRCTGTFGCSRTVVQGLNSEQFATTTQILAGNGVFIQSSKYITATTGSTKKAIFEVSSTAFNVNIQCKEVEVSAATTILYDKNTLATQPTTLQGINGGNCIITDNAGSMRFATSTASIVRDVYDNVAGANWLSDVKILGDKLALAWSSGVDSTIRYVNGAMRFKTAGTDRMTISGTGFGTTTVVGLAISGGQGTSTSDVGWNITTGCYAINGTCIGGGSGSGTVTSVAQTVPAGFSVSGSPVTTTGTLGISFLAANNAILTANSSGNGIVATSASPLYVDALTATSTVKNSSFSNLLGLGTTTPQWNLNIATTTRAQVALQGANTDNVFTLRSIGGHFYLSTSSPTTYATNTLPILDVDSTAASSFAFATATPTSLGNNVMSIHGSLFVGRKDGITLANSTSTFDGNVRALGTVQAGAGSMYMDTTSVHSGDGTLNVSTNGSTLPGSVTLSSLSTDSTIGLAGITCLTGSNVLVKMSGSGTCIVSSKKFKHDIKTLDISALDLVNQLKPSSFIYNSTGRKQWGFIAEELSGVSKELATYDEKGDPFSLDIPGILAVNTKAIQELSMRQGVTRTFEENWQWGAIGLLFLWNLVLTFKKRK